MRRSFFTIASLILLLVHFIPVGIPAAHASKASEQTLSLLFPGTKAGDNLALDPGDRVGSYLVAYFARLHQVIYSELDARRYAISLGIIERNQDINAPLDLGLLRQLSYRHRILFSEDPVALKHGTDGDIGRHILIENYSTTKIINDYIGYYEDRLKETTLPEYMKATLRLRKIRFERLLTEEKNQIPVGNGVQLDVPYFKQERSLSCEMASLRSLLAFYNIQQTEKALIEQLGIALPLVYIDGIWGDPQEAFVGKIDGRQSDKSGYGTLWKPVARVGKLHKESIDWFENGNLTTLTKSLEAGHPIIIWSVVPAKGGFFEYSWKTPAGATVTGYNGEHSWLVSGYKGTAANPTEFTILDPYFGKKTVTSAELVKQWARFGNSGVKVD